MKSILHITIILLTLTLTKLNAQDLHFSQFWDAPLLHNPSFAGNYTNNTRAIIGYRSQWGSVTSSPFKTFGASVDMRLNTSPKDNYFAGGISIYTDVAGASKMRTTLANLAAAYHFKINKQNYFSGGLQVGFKQKNVDSYELRFFNQYDGFGHNSGINSNENLTNSSEVKPTVSAGISYTWSNAFGRTTNNSIQEKKNINIGFAIHYFNAPRFYFYHQEELGLKYIANFEGSFDTNTSKWTIKPAAFIAVQNKATDIVFGSLFQYTLKNDSQITDFKKSTSIGFGGYYRFKDALIPTIQVQLASFNIGFSYDVNLSQLSGASKSNGGFEISLKYTSQNSALGRTSRARYL